MAEPVPAPRPRQHRARANDGVLLRAAARALAARGWDQLAFTAVAQEASLTTRPLYDRYGDRAGLGVALWESGPGPQLLERLTALLDLMVPPPAAGAASPPMGPAAGAASPPTPDALLAAYEPFVRPEGDLDTAVDLIAAVEVCPDLHDVVSATVHRAAGRRLLVSQGADPVVAAGCAYVLITALGLLLGSRRSAAAEASVAPEVLELAEALRHPTAVVPLPDVDASHMRGNRVVTDDPALSALLSATLQVVGERGYHAATTARIVATAGVSEGLLYGRYASKLDLFLDATDRSLGEAFALNLRMSEQLTEEHGPAVSEAVVFRESLRPEHATGRMQAIEQLRLGWHSTGMRAHLDAAEQQVLQRFMAGKGPEQQDSVQSYLHWGLCLAYGNYLLASLVPESWTLPFVTIVGPLAHLP